MNKKYIYILLVLLGLIYLRVQLNSIAEEQTQQENLIEEEEEEGLPGEFYFKHRVHPNEAFSVKSYTKGLSIAQQKSLQKVSAGFDTDWKQQGPANIGARVNSIAIHPTNNDIIYLGFSTGGVFKTTDGGDNWEAIFDDQTYLSIGDIAIDPTNPSTVYVGTGDPNITGYPFIGGGIYKSIDAGATWMNMGLAEQRIISKIAIDTINPDIIYAACMGLPFERNAQRGLYKSLDGGESWAQILFLDNQTGVIDMLLNPINPQVVYAAGWERIRNNQESLLYGNGSKIYRSDDGGNNWTTLSNGLPSGKQGRIGLAMSGSNPNLIYALYVDTLQNIEGLYRSFDSGDNWTEISTASMPSNVTGGMGWYFGKLAVNPTNDSEIFILGVNSVKTTNNGTTWSNVADFNVHVDHHDLVFDDDGNTYIGTDGGAYMQPINTTVWLDIEDIATTQFYRVGYNPNNPNRYYGGAQDNGTVAGSSTDIANWDRLFGGDGFQAVFHPTDPNTFYVETQNGNIRMTQDGNIFNSATGGIDNNDRRNWDMQYIMSTHNPNTLYTGTYRVYKTTNDGIPQWSTISGDLTDGVLTSPGFHTISTLDESPIDDQFLLVGTSDGNVWKTENGGTDWTAIHSNLPDRYVSSVVNSPDNSNHVFVGFTGYKDNNFSPLIYRSTDRGDSWEDIAGDLPPLSINDIFVMPNYNDLVIFVATDGGVYGTKNGGTTWERLGGNMPFIIVFDLELNIANNELIAATHARSIMTFPLDSIGVLANPSFFNLQGTIATETGVLIDSVTIRFDEEDSSTILTDVNGNFTTNPQVVGTGCTLRPSKVSNFRKGLSTVDILLMQKHILGVEPFDSPYKTIAADINGNQAVSGTDITPLRKLLVFITDTLPDNIAWRFVPNSHNFESNFDPWTPSLTEAYECSAETTNQTIDFTAIKMGDVSQSYSNFTGSQTRITDRVLSFELDDQKLKVGEIYEIAFKAKEFKNIMGCQFSLQFHPAKLKYLDFETIELTGLNQQHLGTRYINNGILNLSWDYLAGLTIADGEILFKLSFQAIQPVQLKDAFSFNNNFLNKEVYDLNGDIMDLQIDFIEEQKTSLSSSDISNYPNPFSNQTLIEFELLTDTDVQLKIVDANGQLVHEENTFRHKTNPSITIRRSQLNGSGIYFYTLAFDGQLKSGKMIVQ